MIIRQNQQNQNNQSQAPILGQQGSGVIGSGQGQAKNISGKGSGYTNLQSYISANEPDTGKGNANVQLVRNREQQAQEAQQKAQSDFSSQANQVRQGLQGVQGIQNLVTRSVNDPTKVQSNDIQRIRNLATGKEAFKNPTDYLSQIQSAGGNLGTQRQNISQSLQTDTGVGLQDYLRNQRANPAQATQGETRLDRFLTQSTPSGVNAIEQAQQRAKEIQSLQTPEEVAQINQFASQLNPNLTSGESIQNYLNQSFDPEKQYLANLNKSQLASYMGVDTNKINQNKNLYDTYQSEKARIEGDIARQNQALAQLSGETSMSNPLFVGISGGGGMALNTIFRNEQIAQQQREIQAQQQNSRKQYDQLLRSANWSPELINQYNNYMAQSQKTKQDILSQYDPNRLARIQALAQLSGQDINSLLQGGLV